jgi:hypothetical protein
MLKQTFTLDELDLRNVTSEVVTYHGRRALRLLDNPANEHALAILTSSDFHNGIIETEIAGAPRPDAPPDMRGFVGVAFRVQPQGSAFECFYLRPTNGRADDQLRRNHSTQYISHPDYPWYCLRSEMPGVYESYTDLVTCEWTKIKLVVEGVRAQLYVNGAEQPCLIVAHIAKRIFLPSPSKILAKVLSTRYDLHIASADGGTMMTSSADFRDGESPNAEQEEFQEEQRAAAELFRQEAEVERQHAEDARSTAEEARQAAEVYRLRAEELRREAENLREAAEQLRQFYEKERSFADEQRQFMIELQQTMREMRAWVEKQGG